MNGAGTTDRITAAWQSHRHHLQGIAWRILNDDADAEDAVQDAFARLTRQDLEGIRDVRGWLTVVVRRIALDRLGSAHRRRSAARAPEVLDGIPATNSQDPSEIVSLEDEIRHAMAVLLYRLTPPQRTAFLLHDIFGLPHARIGELTGRSEGACRQLSSEARKALRADAPNSAADAGSRPDELARRFVHASRDGDVNALAALLTPAVEGKVTMAGKAIGWAHGPSDVAQKTVYYLGPRSPWILAPVDVEDGAGMIATLHGDPVFIGMLTVDGGRIASMHGLLLPRA